MLQWSMDELAAKAGVSVSTIRRIEAVLGIPKIGPDIYSALYKTFYEAGVRFLLDDGSPDGGPGVVYHYPARGTPSDPVRLPHTEVS